ncbi:unnamed protein product [Protopolystoma xenopodis]|uniref:Uncharacterized protein n=1 Tax=Protopolystoma xenopodis TaxID=117903 RepID=A0A448WAM3_9PLAT|nr:unnamed protein product [Protopolystoma xenopodis]
MPLLHLILYPYSVAQSLFHNVKSNFPTDNCAKSLKCSRHRQLPRVDLFRLVQFAEVNGLIRRLQCYPISDLPASMTQALSTKPPLPLSSPLPTSPSFNSTSLAKGMMPIISPDGPVAGISAIGDPARSLGILNRTDVSVAHMQSRVTSEEEHSVQQSLLIPQQQQQHNPLLASFPSDHPSGHTISEPVYSSGNARIMRRWEAIRCQLMDGLHSLETISARECLAPVSDKSVLYGYSTNRLMRRLLQTMRIENPDGLLDEMPPEGIPDLGDEEDEEDDDVNMEDQDYEWLEERLDELRGEGEKRGSSEIELDGQERGEEEEYGGANTGDKSEADCEEIQPQLVVDVEEVKGEPSGRSFRCRNRQRQCKGPMVAKPLEGQSSFYHEDQAPTSGPGSKTSSVPSLYMLWR